MTSWTTGNTMDLVSLDLSKTFDSVPCRKLFDNLENKDKCYNHRINMEFDKREITKSYVEFSY